MRWLLTSTFLLFATSVAAEEVGPSGYTSAAHLVATGFGVLLAIRLAMAAFAKPELDFAGVKTEPKYLTSSHNYRVGRYLFVGLAVLFFLMLLLLDKEVLAVVNLFKVPIVPGSFYQSLIEAMSAKSVPYLVVIVFIGVVYLFFLHHEGEWNVLLALRNSIHDWIAIPSRAKTLVRDILRHLTTPIAWRQDVVAGSWSVAATDFDEKQDSLERTWAEISYMKVWLEKQSESDTSNFFSNPGFDLDTLSEEYKTDLATVESSKQNRPPLTVAPVPESVQKLHEKYARAAACFLIYNNGIDRKLDRVAETFGLPEKTRDDKNPLKYIIIYIVTVALAVYVGVCVSSVSFDWRFEGVSLLTALSSQDPDIVIRWICYTAANFCTAIAVVLFMRYLKWRSDRTDNSSYIGIYFWTAAIAFLVGPLGLTIAVKYIFPVYRFVEMNFVDVFVYELRWGIGPAIIAVFISYYMDRLTSEVLSDPIRSRSSILWRIFLSFLIASVTIAFLAIPLLSISAAPGSPSPSSPWTTEKLRFVATGTTFFVVFSLAMVAQFGLWKSQPKPAAPRPAVERT